MEGGGEYVLCWQTGMLQAHLVLHQEGLKSGASHTEDKLFKQKKDVGNSTKKLGVSTP